MLSALVLVPSAITETWKQGMRKKQENAVCPGSMKEAS